MNRLKSTFSLMGVLVSIVLLVAWAVTNGGRVQSRQTAYVKHWSAVYGVGQGHLYLTIIHENGAPIQGPAIGTNRIVTPTMQAWENSFGHTEMHEGLGFNVMYGPLIASARGNFLFMYGYSWSAGIPIWAMILLFAFPPLLYYRRRAQVRRRNRMRDGLCVNCGYDLRATPDRCPECGRPSESAAVSIV